MKRQTRTFLLFLTVSLVFRGLFLCLFHERISADLRNWDDVADCFRRGENPYQATSVLVWPPVWMQIIFFCDRISQFMHWRFFAVVKGFLILGECALAGLLCATIVRFTKSKDVAKTIIIGMAINPICIYQVCLHGNFDVLVGFWILLAVHMLLRFQENQEPQFWLLACFALGMGAVTKTVPLSLAPLLLLSARKLKPSELGLGAALLLGPILLGLSILYVLTPADIATKVLGYRSSPVQFGFSGLLGIFGAHGLRAVWTVVFEILYGGGWILSGIWLLTRETLDRRRIISLAALLLLAVVAFGPGGGLHYVYWFLPLLLLQYELEGRKTRLFLLVLYAVAAASYTLEYALSDAYGSFLLDLTQNESLLKWARAITTGTDETMVMLPLWVLYCFYVIHAGAVIGREMSSDLRGLFWRKQF